METRSNYRLHLLTAIALLVVAGLAFFIWQNHYASVGGGISLAKALWLVTALVSLYLIPGWLARDSDLSASERKRYTIFFYGFLLRAVIELPVIMFTREWRCWHGISHNLVMLALLWMMRRGSDRARYDVLLTLVLLAESLNAWLFSTAGNPEIGIYFADNSTRFAQINIITWVELFILVPLLVIWLWGYVKGGGLRESAL
jgi:hypothetical protein